MPLFSSSSSPALDRSVQQEQAPGQEGLHGDAGLQRHRVPRAQGGVAERGERGSKQYALTFF